MLREIYNENENKKVNSREINKLKENFPQYFNKNGDFKIDEFKKMLEDDEVNFDKEGYRLDFLGKSYARFESALETETVITPDTKHNNEEINENSENMYIVGDNIDALKHLLNSYSGKVKCIYIDPPYNTGSDGFVYPDNFKFDKDTLSNKMGVSEEEADRILSLQGKSTHSAWLTFMYPRLLLARDLLAEDGVIFISIDDNEQANLKMICDEIYGEENFIAQLVRNTNSSKNQSLFVSVTYDYVLLYSHNKVILEEKHSNNKWSVYKNNISEYESKIKELRKKDLSDDEITEELKQLTKYPRFIDFTNYWYFDDRGLYAKDNLGGVKNGNQTPIINPITNEYDPIPPGGFRYTTKKLNELISDKRIHFHEDGSLPRLKRYLSENRTQTPKGIMSDDQRPDETLMKEFNTPFENPKQLAFISRILSIFDKDSLILDFYSGSSTTAHASMQLNSEDGGNRKYIMVQIPEEIDKNQPAYKSGYRTIDEIGRERIKRAADKIRKETNADIDYGFKLYRLNEPTVQTIDKLIDFDPNDINFNEDDYVSNFEFDGENGKDTILTTWLNEDGYGLLAQANPFKIGDYEAYKYKNSLYIINPGINSNDVMELIKLLEKNQLDINRVVAYGYSLNFNISNELRNNLKNLKNNQSVSLIERY